MTSTELHLNVGGERFVTSKATLISAGGYFAALLSGNWQERDAIAGTNNSPIFIGRGKDA